VDAQQVPEDIGDPGRRGDDAVLVDGQNLVLWSDMVRMSQANSEYKSRPPRQPTARSQPCLVSRAVPTPENARRDPGNTSEGPKAGAAGKAKR